MMSRGSIVTVDVMQCNMLVLSVISFFFVSVCFAYSDRFSRQASDGKENDCLPSSRLPMRPPPECCKLADFNEIINLEQSSECEDKKPSLPPLGQRPPEPPTSGFVDEIRCYIQCLYNEAGLLNKDNELDKELIKQYVKKAFASNPEWLEITSEGVTKCIDKSVFNGTETHKCKSGAIEFKWCLTRHMFLNCPEHLWTSSDECTEIKSTAEKCPRMPVPFNFMRRRVGPFAILP